MRRVKICVMMLWCAHALACEGNLNQDDPTEPRDMGSKDLSTSADLGGSGERDQGVIHTREDMDLAPGADMQPRMDMPPGMDMAPPVNPRLAYLDPNYNANIQIYAGDQDTLFQCSDPATLDVLMPGRIRRIERVEWVRNVGRELATPARGNGRAGTNPFNVNSASPYSSFRNGESLDSVMLDQYLGMMDIASQGWTSSTGNPLVQWRRLTPAKCIINTTTPDNACLETFVRTILEEAVYYRPPTDDEVQRLLAFASATYVDVNAGKIDGPKAIELIMSAARLTTPSLFHHELGGEPDAQGRRALSDWEIAHAIALSLGGRSAGALANFNSGNTPSYDVPWEDGHMASIVAAVNDGTIKDRAVLADLIREYAGGFSGSREDIAPDYRQTSRENRGEYYVAEGIARFFRQWLQVDTALTTFKDTVHATSAFEDLTQFGDRFTYKDDLAPGRIPQNTSYDPSCSGSGCRKNSWERDQKSAIQNSYTQMQTQRYDWDNLQPDLVQQLDDMIARIVMGDDAMGGQQVFENLFTSRQFYVPSNDHGLMASTHTHVRHAPRVYGITGTVSDSQTDRWRTLPADERAGVLTHPAWLAAHSDNFENGTGIIYRGKWIRENLLCDHMYPPSGDIEAKLDPRNGQTARERVSSATDQPGTPCVGCHTDMNPLGYPFEIYNHAGFLRQDDHGQAPSGVSTIKNVYGDAALDGVQVNSAIDFSQKIAQSSHAKRCFIRQTFRYFMGRYETPYDACTLTQMEQAYELHNGSFIEMLVALMTSDAFLYRIDLPDNR